MSYKSMKWLKYQHKHSSGHSGWEWKPLLITADGTKINDEYVREEILPDIVAQYEHSEKYSGVDYEIIDKPPSWVITEHVKASSKRLDAAYRNHQFWQSYLHETTIDNGNGVGWEDCKQCEGATVATKENRHYLSVRPCPSCGRDIVYSTLKYILMPDDKDAVKLLGSLVEKGARKIKSKKFRWPVEDKEEEEAFDRLVKLGLAGGSSYRDVYEIHATKSGEAEWPKHKGTS